MLYLLCLQCYYCIFRSPAFRSVIISVPAVNACKPLLFLRGRGVDELQSCPPSPDEIKLGHCLCLPLQPCIPCWAGRVMSWALPSRAVSGLSPVPRVTISRADPKLPPSLSWFHWLPHQTEGMREDEWPGSCSSRRISQYLWFREIPEAHQVCVRTGYNSPQIA